MCRVILARPARIHDSDRTSANGLEQIICPVSHQNSKDNVDGQSLQTPISCGHVVDELPRGNLANWLREIDPSATTRDFDSVSRSHHHRATHDDADGGSRRNGSRRGDSAGQHAGRRDGSRSSHGECAQSSSTGRARDPGRCRARDSGRRCSCSSRRRGQSGERNSRCGFRSTGGSSFAASKWGHPGCRSVRAGRGPCTGC